MKRAGEELGFFRPPSTVHRPPNHMQQVLFWIPIPNPWMPEGFPVYGFGLMLFLTFLTSTWIAARQARREGIDPQVIQDLAVWIFVGGIAGARVVFMIQYGIPWWQFFEIWKGGLVFYGSAAGGALAYAAAWWFIVRKRGYNYRQLADIMAPAVAWGLVLGRIGCLLNGCCFGDVACADCPAIHFPLAAPPRYQLVQNGYQTAAGYAVLDRHLQGDDPRTVVSVVEANSPAASAGLRAGDLVLKVDGLDNQRLFEVKSTPEALAALAPKLSGARMSLGLDEYGTARDLYGYDDLAAYQNDLAKARTNTAVEVGRSDTLTDYLVRRWPRGKSDLQLTVRHADGSEEALPAFAPRTLGLHPTQVYESVSMFLLFLFLTAFLPFRRHYGEVFVLLMVCYAAHRFLNEMLRNDTKPVAFDMTLSQNGSIVVMALGIALFIGLWRQPPDPGLRPKVEKPAENPIPQPA